MRPPRFLAALAVLLLALPARADGPRGTDYAVLVACTRYDEKELRSLQYTRNDIEAFHRLLLDSGFAKDNVVLMHEGQPADLLPEKRKIRKQLDLVLAGARPEDSVIVALSGHGVQYKGDRAHYFCPRDAELEDRATLLELDAVYKQLAACKARRKLLLVDACRNDPLSALGKSRPSVELESDSRPQTEAVPEGIVALFSCSGGQRSYEHPDLGHGIFFYHLLQGWDGAAAGRDGAVTLQTLVDYAAKGTQQFARLKLGAVQVPQQRNEFSGVWVLREAADEVRRFTDLGGLPNGLALVNDGRLLIACTRGDGTETTTADDPGTKRPELSVWDALGGRQLARYTIRSGVS